jgi:sugar diacid utilization regulator
LIQNKKILLANKKYLYEEEGSIKRAAQRLNVHPNTPLSFPTQMILGE